jgi:hypothetical protein
MLPVHLRSDCFLLDNVLGYEFYPMHVATVAMLFWLRIMLLVVGKASQCPLSHLNVERYQVARLFLSFAILAAARSAP